MKTNKKNGGILSELFFKPSLPENPKEYNKDYQWLLRRAEKHKKNGDDWQLNLLGDCIDRGLFPKQKQKQVILLIRRKNIKGLILTIGAAIILFADYLYLLTY